MRCHCATPAWHHCSSDTVILSRIGPGAVSANGPAGPIRVNRHIRRRCLMNRLRERTLPAAGLASRRRTAHAIAQWAGTHAGAPPCGFAAPGTPVGIILGSRTGWPDGGARITAARDPCGRPWGSSRSPVGIGDLPQRHAQVVDDHPEHASPQPALSLLVRHLPGWHVVRHHSPLRPSPSRRPSIARGSPAHLICHTAAAARPTPCSAVVY